MLWIRYIDDIFQIWTHCIEEFRKFEKHLNQSVDSIKFETDISTSEVHFLDVTVKLDNGNLETSLYTKPTDAHNYLSFKSCHPKNCKKAIPYSQFLRVRRIYSNDDDYIKHGKDLARHFLRAEYPANVVQQAFERAYDKERRLLLYPAPKQVLSDKDIIPEIFLISTYHPSGSFLDQLIRKNRYLLDRSSSTRSILNWKIT